MTDPILAVTMDSSAVPKQADVAGPSVCEPRMSILQGGDQDMSIGGFSEVIGKLQAAVDSVLIERGFEVRDRTYNRRIDDGLVQVADIQLYPSNLPYVGWHLHVGRFTINLGVYVPEVEHCCIGPTDTSWIEEPRCTIRERLGPATGYPGDLWWPFPYKQSDLDDVVWRLENGGVAFLEKHSTRDDIIAALAQPDAPTSLNLPGEVMRAIMLAHRGDKELSRQVFAEYISGITMPPHEEYVRKLAKRAGIWNLAPSV